MIKTNGFTPRFSILLLALALTGFTTSNLNAQGALTPPGAPAPMMKSLAQIEPRTPISSVPFTISVPGSYYLTTNLVQNGSAGGIIISANDVTLDLGGFTIRGNGSGSFVIGIFAYNATNVAVHSGKVIGWSGCGFASAGAKNILARDLAALGNLLGIYLTDPSSVIESCVVQTNATTGLSLGDAGVIRNCSAGGNGGNGVQLIGSGGVLENSQANNNGGTGIALLGSGCVVSHCTAIQNNGDGITAPDGNRISDTTVNFNKGNGIAATFNCAITRCYLDGNTSNGISASARSEVRDNFCTGNLGAGIFIQPNQFAFGGTRVENNHIVGGVLGIQVAGPGHFIVRNTVTGTSGSSYVISSNNIVGVIIAPPKSLAINGATGGAGVGTTDPAANFSF